MSERRKHAAAGKIDESHLLDHGQLEAIRMMTNHQMDSGPPFAVLLVGQPTLRQRMRLGVLAALDQRIGMRYAMPAMTDQETADYVHHHIALAGRADTLLTADALTVRLWHKFRDADVARVASETDIPGVIMVGV